MLLLLRLLLLPVSELTQLCRLQLSGLRVTSSSSSSSTAGSTGSAAITLPRLQELQLYGCKLTVQLLSQLLSATTVTKLYWCDVQLYHRDNWTRKLTGEQECAALWQQLQPLPQLSELTLRLGGIIAADITPLSNLQHLQRLGFVQQYPVLPSDGEEFPTKLMAALQHLTQLQHLELGAFVLRRRSNQVQPEDVSYSALTASTQLTSLALHNEYGMPVPKTAFDHMFPAGHILAHLQELHLTGRPSHACVEAAQVARIAASCPALQQLSLWNVTPEGFDVSCLAQLPLGVTKVEGFTWTRPAL
jgi:hypothetical protein